MKSLFLSLILLFVVGCGTTFRVNVTTYHSLQPKPGNQFAPHNTFDIVAHDKNLRNTLQFKNTAMKISDKLGKIGLKRKEQRPDLLFFVSYDIDRGRTQVGSAPVYGQTGGGTTQFSGSTFGSQGYNSFSGSAYSYPTFGVTGYSTYSYTVFTRKMNLQVVDVKASNGKDVKIMYEAKAISRGSSGNIDEVLPYMVEAIFKDFPGENGKTKKVDLNKKDLENE